LAESADRAKTPNHTGVNFSDKLLPLYAWINMLSGWVPPRTGMNGTPKENI